MPTYTNEYLIISSSLRSESRSRLMAEQIQNIYATLGKAQRLIDLRYFPLPLCDAESAYRHPHVPTISDALKQARVIIIASPIYNYDVNAAMKNLIELTGSQWEDKIVGFLCAAGGGSSYMAIMSLANSLMLDFRCLIIPRFVYAKGEDFDGVNVSADLSTRIAQLALDSTKIVRE